MLGLSTIRSRTTFFNRRHENHAIPMSMRTNNATSIISCQISMGCKSLTTILQTAPAVRGELVKLSR